MLAAGVAECVAAVKPPLKWAGGKRWLVPYVLPFWRPERHRRLVETLCGGARSCAQPDARACSTQRH